jgi:hypothetical protein
MLRAACAVHSVIGSSGEVPQTVNTSNFTDATTGVTATGSLIVPANGAALIGTALAVVASSTPTVAPTNYTTDLIGTALGISAYSTGEDSTYGLRSYTSVWSGNTPQSAAGVYAAWMAPIS